MRNNTYGIVKPSKVDINNDVEIWYHYMPSRTSEDYDFQEFRKIESPIDIFKPATVDPDDTDFSDTNLLGMYKLSLPVETFGRKGIYTIYIKPKEYRCTIKDVGVLAAFPDVSGIVIDLNELETMSDAMFANDNLVGYRVEYFETNGQSLTRQEYYRLITSNNHCEPVTQTLNSAYSNTNGYRFNDTGSLAFLTVTPSTSPDFKANSTPYIGAPQQVICITNTKFDPIMLEVEIVEHDIETLSIMEEGNMVRDLDRGRVTHYNFDNEIYKQYEFFTVKDNYTSNSVAEVRVNRNNNIDNSLDINQLISE